MLAEFPANQAFTVAWFGLMTLVWFGWAQEDPPTKARLWLGIGSVLGIALAGFFGPAVVTRWSDGNIIDGATGPAFAVVTVIEVLAALLGSIWLHRTGKGRWIAWWIAMVVALHFIPLGLIVLGDLSVVILGCVQAAMLLAIIRSLKRQSGTTSRVVGPMLGATLLIFGLAGAIAYAARWGLPPW